MKITGTTTPQAILMVKVPIRTKRCFALELFALELLALELFALILLALELLALELFALERLALLLLEPLLRQVTLDSLDDSGFQLVLPSGATIGHRSLLRYYK